MIKFFRKIRYDLMEKNKTGNYLKYATGEIVLVVFGILIALQINNLNNDLKDKKAEIKYLEQITNSLEDNRLILTTKIEEDKIIYKLGIKLFNDLKNQKVLNDTLRALLFIPLRDEAVSFNTAAYENLKNNGLSLISTDAIKFDIINVYDQDLKEIQITFADQFENFISTVINPFYSKHFEFDNTERVGQMTIKPNDYQRLLQNREMTNILSMINSFRAGAISNYEETVGKIDDLLEKLATETNRLKN